MKITPVILIASLVIISGCTGKGSGSKNPGTESGTVSAADTGYTGITQYKSGQYLIKEVTFKNGVRHGLMKSFYQGGQVYQTFWYENGLREDSVRWYFPDGMLFRSTPYVHDTVDGIQKQYYRTGKVKAKIGYIKGMRSPFFEEFTQYGKLVKGYPEITVGIHDEYKSKGLYSITLGLSDKSKQVSFYKGEFTDGRFDTARYSIIKATAGKGILSLRKTGTPSADYVGVIAEIITPFGNKLLSYKKIDLPYPDLK